MALILLGCDGGFGVSAKIFKSYIEKNIKVEYIILIIGENYNNAKPKYF